MVPTKYVLSSLSNLTGVLSADHRRLPLAAGLSIVFGKRNALL